VITLLDPANTTYFPAQNQRILICTPSHTAANVIVQRLSPHFDQSKMLRLIGPERNVATIPVSILGYCRHDPATTLFKVPHDILAYSIVVCTCLDAHLLYNVGLANMQLRIRRQCFYNGLKKECEGTNINIAKIDGVNEPHFRYVTCCFLFRFLTIVINIVLFLQSHLFIDESAQATEPEILVPLSIVLDPENGIQKAEVVLVGDPRQLSPQIYSTTAARAGLGRSLMERLLLRPVSCLGSGRDHLLGTEVDMVQIDDWLRYSLRRGGQDQLSVFLTVNYRGHPSFLMLPSSLFYSDKLQCAAKTSVNKSDELFWCEKLRHLEAMANPVKAIDAKGLLQKKQYTWPIHFRGVNGQDASVSVKCGFSSDSWSNELEAVAVCNIITTLVENGVATNSIGVMSPFRGQVVLIREYLRQKALGTVDVGTIEDYQSMERQVIVLSLTRSSSSLVHNDMEKCIGVFGQTKRSNVALTRAEKAFIVVGNPRTMMKDMVWRQFLFFCYRNGLWYGESCAVMINEVADNSRVVSNGTPLLREIYNGNKESTTCFVISSLEKTLRDEKGPFKP
jgi:helicase MOV-10